AGGSRRPALRNAGRGVAEDLLRRPARRRGAARRRSCAARVVRARPRPLPPDRRDAGGGLGHARLAERGAPLRDRVDRVDARLLPAEAARPHGPSTPTPAGGTAGSGPPLSSAAIWPQSGWWPTTTTSSPWPAITARTSSAVAPGARRSSGSVAQPSAR